MRATTVISVVALLGAISLAVASLSTAPAGQKTWYWQNPYPQGNTLLRVAAGTSHLWAVGGPGVVLFSSNGGAVWDAQDPHTSATLRAVDFVDDQNGWVVGEGGTIQATVDGGSNWTTQTSGVNGVLRGVSMATAQIGWVVGDTGTALKTTNGGVAWNAQGDTAVRLNDVCAVDSTHAWAVGAAAEGSSTIRATFDGGSTWTTQSVPTTSSLSAVSFVDTQTGFAVGAASDGVGTILKTTDGGSTWTTASAGATEDLTDVEFVSASKGWIAESSATGTTGAIRCTTDGGTTWKLQTSGVRGVNGLASLSSSNVHGVGHAGAMLRTVDAGATWAVQTFATVSQLLDVAFADASNGWAVGAGGAIVHTSDGGASWLPTDSGTAENLRGLDMVSANLGWAVGDAGTILMTSDGTRTAQASGVTANLRGVDFVDASHGWAVGDSASIRVTADGGSTWTTPTTSVTTDTPLYGVSMVTTQTGWAWGGASDVSGLLLHTADGGVNWSQQEPNVATGVVLRAGSFVTTSTGWIAGTDGVVRKTIDGGSTWTTQTVGTTAAIYGLKFVDADTGYHVGGTGGTNMSVVRKTIDGGSTWTTQTPGTANVLYAVDFVDVDNGWTVGDSGTILRTTDTTPPNTDMTVKPSTPDGTNGWYVTPPTVSLSISEPGITYYSWDSATGPWSMYSEPFARTVEGTSTLRYYSIDPGGNAEAVKSGILLYDATPPTIPGTPTASPTSTSTVVVSWPSAADAVSGIGHYEVRVNGFAATTSASTSALVSGLSTETAYSLSVIAVDGAGNSSAESSATTAITLAPLPRPSASVYARAVGVLGVYVDWGESTGTVPPVSYHVWRAVEGGPFSAIATLSAGDSRSYQDTSAPAFGSLAYRVSVVDARGEGSQSDQTALTSTLSTALPAPVNISAVNTASVLVTWTPVALPSARYNVYRSTTSTGTPELQTGAPIAAASYHDTSTADYTEYWYRVATVDTSDNVGVPSPPVHIRTDASGTAEPPHGAYAEDTDFCALCHSVHTSAASQTVQQPAGSESTPGSALLRGATIDAPLCFSCHDGTSASDVLTEYTDESRTSKHPVPIDTSGDGLVCASCHAVHSLAATDTVKGLISSGGKKSGNAFCYSCHGDTAGVKPRGDLRGFEGSAHSTGVVEPPTGTKVVCLSCHVSHSSREAALYPYSGDDRCLGCHTTGVFTGAGADIAARLGGPGPDTRHDLLSADSSTKGSRLACGNCHEPHTSSATTPCVDPFKPTTEGGMSAAGDTLCLACHAGVLPTSADTSGWVAAPLAAGGATYTVNIASSWETTSVHGAGASVSPSLTTTMGYSAGDTLVCGSCHDSHGSPNRFTLLDTVSAKTGTPTADALLVVPVGASGTDLRFFCASCHNLSAAIHPDAAHGGADLTAFPIDCTASGCHTHVGSGL